MATDYDCWHPHHDQVSVEAVVAMLHTNVHNAKRIIADTIPRLVANRTPSAAHRALAGTIMTQTDRIDPDARARLDLLIGRYLG
jgi:5'-methylthioadenosine phosphorylase